MINNIKNDYPKEKQNIFPNKPFKSSKNLTGKKNGDFETLYIKIKQYISNFI